MKAAGVVEIHVGNRTTVVPIVALLTVVHCCVLRFQAADGECKVCPRPTATKPGWDAGGPVGCTIDEELGNLPRLLLVPG